MMLNRIALILSLLLSLSAQGRTIPVDWGRIDLLYDFVQHFKDAAVSPADIPSSVSDNEIIQGIAYPGIFLHTNPQDWSCIAYPAIELPPTGTNEQLILMLSYSIRDGVPFDPAQKPHCDGVEFSVLVNGTERLADRQEDRQVRSAGWRDATLNLTEYAGQTITITLRTHPLMTTDYDWAVFGDPLLLHLKIEGTEEISLLDQHTIIPLDWSRFTQGIVTLNITAAEAEFQSTIGLEQGGVFLLEQLAASHSSTSETPAPSGYLFSIENYGPNQPARLLQTVPGALERIGIYRHTAQIEVVEAGITDSLLFAGQKTKAKIEVRNTGRGPLPAEDRAQIALGFQRPSGEYTETLSPALPSIKPGESLGIRFDEVTFPVSGHYELWTRSSPHQHAVFHERFTVHTPAELHMAVPAPRRKEPALMDTGLLRVEFAIDEHNRFAGYGTIWTRSSLESDWTRTATLHPLAELITANPDGSRHVCDLTFEPLSMEEENVAVFQSHSDDDGYTIRVRFQWDEAVHSIRIETTLHVSRETPLLRLAGPRLAVGDGSFRLLHDGALFGGLEYLGTNERTSSVKDAAPPLNRRSIPNPRKIAVPLMAVSYQGIIAATFWEPWTGDDPRHLKQLAAHFDSGSPGSPREYTLMQLSLPAVSEVRPEHALSAKTPVLVRENETISIPQVLYLDHTQSPSCPTITSNQLPGEDVLAAVAQFYRIMPLADPPHPPRNWDAEKDLSRMAWKGALWEADSQGWRHCAGPSWTPEPSPGFATLLLFDAYTQLFPAQSRQLSEFVMQTINKAVSERGPSYLWAGLNCHIMEAEYPFYGGYLLEAMQGWKQAVQVTLETQLPDGGWGWHPSSPKHEALGKDGEQTSGTIANHAWRILRYTRVTGDLTFREAGLKGIDALERHRIPRGAQGWECPMNAPDILASAYAIRANVEAYRCTNDKLFLDRARYWAWSGLPFVYTWNLNHLPLMRSATIPIMGATFFTHSWFGVPVNWCGLVYAYALQELYEYDPRDLWINTAQGIVTSTEWMQYPESHPHAGCYPDSYNLMLEKAYPADINPEDIMVNAYRLRGMGVHIKTIQTEGYTISSGSVLAPSASPDAKSLQFTSSFFDGKPAYTLIYPFTHEPAIWVQGELWDGTSEKVIPKVDSTQFVTEGWRYNPDLHMLELKLTYGAKPVTVEIR